MKGSDTNKKLCQVVPHLFSSKKKGLRILSHISWIYSTAAIPSVNAGWFIFFFFWETEEAALPTDRFPEGDVTEALWYL